MELCGEAEASGSPLTRMRIVIVSVSFGMDVRLFPKSAGLRDIDVDATQG